MPKKYVIVLPVHKDPRIIPVGGAEKIKEIIENNAFRSPRFTACRTCGIDTVVASVSGKKKENYEINKRATIFAGIEPDEEKIYYHAVIASGDGVENIKGFSLKEANELLCFITSLSD